MEIVQTNPTLPAQTNCCSFTRFKACLLGRRVAHAAHCALIGMGMFSPFFIPNVPLAGAIFGTASFCGYT